MRSATSMPEMTGMSTSKRYKSNPPFLSRQSKSSKGSSKVTSGRRFSPVTFLMAYL